MSLTGRSKEHVFLKGKQKAGNSSCSWDTFCTFRVDYLTVLTETVERGFTRRDTKHPAFCGCIDWHSSVHGAYGLLTAARLTGNVVGLKLSMQLS